MDENLKWVLIKTTLRKVLKDLLECRGKAPNRMVSALFAMIYANVNLCWDAGLIPEEEWPGWQEVIFITNAAMQHYSSLDPDAVEDLTVYQKAARDTPLHTMTDAIMAAAKRAGQRQ